MAAAVVNSGARTFRISADAVAGIQSHLKASGGSAGRGILFGSGDQFCEVLLAQPLQGVGQFTASLEDLALFSRLFTMPNTALGSDQLRPVGWYVAKEVGRSQLTDADLQLQSSFFRAEDLILVCEPSGTGEFRLAAASPAPGQQRFAARGWMWPAITACVFALLCITAALSFRHAGNDSTPRDADDTSVYADRAQPQPAISRTPSPSVLPIVSGCAEKPKGGRSVEQLTQELAFQIERNRRLEATLEILRQRRGGTSLSALSNNTATYR